MGIRGPAKSRWNDLATAAHAWKLLVDRIPIQSLDSTQAWLTSPQKSHLDRFKTEKLRHHYLAARALCRITLSHYTGVDPADWSFAAGKYGKPRIARPAEFKTLHFNLTHTDGLVVCILSRAGPVGVDVEKVTRPVDAEQITRHFFSPSERQLMDRLPSRRRNAWFFRQWVLKEAYLKGRGVGLWHSLGGFTIAFDNRGNPMPLNRWQLALHRPARDYIAAAAVQSRRAIPFKWLAAN